jgi:hypothetical protein
MLYPVPLSQRAEKSELIAEGKVILQRSFWDSGHKNIYTSNRVKVYVLLKGNITGDEIEIITEGGTVGFDRQEWSSTLELKTGNTGIFFCIPVTAPVKDDQRKSYMVYSSRQGFIAFNFAGNTAKDPFFDYTSTENALAAVKAITGMEKRIARLPEEEKPAPGRVRTQLAVTITGFSPDSIPAGTGDILSIHGSGFGNERGDGFVEFTNADDGVLTPVRPLPYDYVFWSDDQIRVRVPTVVITSAGLAGTGLFRITTSNGAVVTSTSRLFIPFAYMNINDNGIPAMPDLITDNGPVRGYSLHMSNEFASYTAASAAFVRAMETWSCNTGINWIIEGTTDVNEVAADGVNMVTAAELPVGVLASTTSRYNACGFSSPLNWVVAELDFVFDVSPPLEGWQLGPAAPSLSQYDFESVALHELGHGHQLAHTLNPGTVMYYAIGNGQVVRTLSEEDIEGGIFVMSRSVQPNFCGPLPMVARTCGPLPVDLVSFKGSHDRQSGAHLTWRTARESAMKGYRILRSADGNHFYEIGFVHSNAGVRNNQYEFKDRAGISGKWFYRLGMIGQDGSETFSAIIPLDISVQLTALTIFPNPSLDFIQLSAPGLKMQNARLELFDAEGRKVLSRLFKEIPDAVSVRHLRPGVYVYVFKTAAGNSYTGKLIKR